MKKILTMVMSGMLTLTYLQAQAEDVTYNLNPTVTPKAMSEVERGTKVTLDFGDVEISVPQGVTVTATPQTEFDDGYDVEYVDGTPEPLPLNVDTEGVVYFNFDVTGEPGTLYKLSIARGAITSADGTRATMAKSWKYYLAEEPEGQLKLVNVEPASGSTITPGTVVDLFFNEEVDIETLTDAVTITNLETGAENKSSLCWNFDNWDFSDIQFTMPKGLPNGDYKAYIAADIFTSYTSSEKYGEITLYYTVEGEEGPEGPTAIEVKNFSPASSSVETLSNIINIGFKSQPETLAEGATAELKNDETGKTYTGSMAILDYMEKTIRVIFNYGEDADSSNYLDVAGTYTLTIAANTIFGADGGTNSEITNTWTVTGPIDINDIDYATALPRNGASLSSISSIVINFPSSPSLRKKTGAKISVNNTKYDFTIENNRLTANITPELTEEGSYTVTLPAGSAYSLETGHGNKEITLTYRIEIADSVETMLNEGSDSVTVYNCQGFCILRDGSAEDVRNLPAGFYIVNGKKYLKRQ